MSIGIGLAVILVMIAGMIGFFVGVACQMGHGSSKGKGGKIWWDD
jgi:hypothetical protein